MAGGRPSKGEQQRYPELEELASWFHRALADASYRSIREFLGRGLFEKNAVYGVFGATRLLTLESTQSLAVALKRSAAQVVPIWTRAREARDRATMATRRAQEPRVTSWAEISVPSLALRNLLEAQCASVERLPYELLAVREPPLSSVYVRQQVRVRATTERREWEDTVAGRSVAEELPALGGPQPTVSVLDALEQHNHLIVTGEPGAGKSTMSSYLARSLSRLWLLEDSLVDAPISEPVVPLRVSARSLVGKGSWSTVLAEAACSSFGRSLLEEPDSSLFAGRVQGARWLVLVDGLDEIPDPRLRKEVARSVAQHAQLDSDYRFVVTTRPLPESELAPLHTGDVGSYVIEPFDRPELEEFASKWFAVQQVPAPAVGAERFLRETSDGRLRELVRNPLLATIAALSAVKEPDRSLPASRISLYERFCSYLAGDRSGRPNPAAQLRRRNEDNLDELLVCVRWLHRSRSQVVGALARRRLESQDKLWQAAVEWVGEQAPENVKLIDGWEDYLWEELVGTGLLVAQEHELRFLHQSFAEFLAAQSHAETIGDDFGEVDVWIRRGLRKAERTFALFTFGIWADQPGHNIGVVVDRLLSSRDPRRLLFAGRLMAEGVSIPETMAANMIDRLLALVRNDVDSDSDGDEGFEVLGALFGHPTVPAELDALVRNINIKFSSRVLALEAFVRLQGGERAQLLLAELLPSAYDQSLHQCARIAVQLGQVAIDMVKRRALEVVDELDSDTNARTNAAEVMRILRLVSNVANPARAVLNDVKSAPSHLERAAEAWLAAQGATVVPEIAVLARDRPAHDYEGKARLAAFLHKAGDVKTAQFLADTVLDDEMADGNALSTAAITLLSVRGASAVPNVLVVVDRWFERGNEELWDLAKILKHLAPYPQAAVVSRVRLLLERFPLGCNGMCDFVNALLAVESAEKSVLTAIDHGALLGAFELVWCAWYLQDAGEHAAATELAKRALRSQGSTRYVCKRAALVLLKVDPVAAIAQLAILAEQNRESAWIAGVMDAFTDTDLEIERARVFYARKLLDHPRVDGDELLDALGSLLVLGDESTAQSVAEAARMRPELNFTQRRVLIRALAALGQLDLARSVWAHLLKWQGHTVENDIGLVDDIAKAGAERWTAEQIQQLIDDPATAPLRVQRLRQMLAWLTAGYGSIGGN